MIDIDIDITLLQARRVPHDIALFSLVIGLSRWLNVAVCNTRLARIIIAMPESNVHENDEKEKAAAPKRPN